MSEFGMMAVDWEERVNFDRMRRERLRKAQGAMTKAGVDALYVFSLGFQALLDNLKPGVKEFELLAIAWQKFTELGSEWTRYANIVCSGPYTAPYRRFTSDRVIRAKGTR